MAASVFTLLRQRSFGCNKPAEQLFSSQSKLPASHASCVLLSGDRLRHLRELGQPEKDSDQQPQVGIIHEVLIRPDSEIHQQYQKNDCIPPNPESNRKINSLAKLPNDTPPVPNKDQ